MAFWLWTIFNGDRQVNRRAAIGNVFSKDWKPHGSCLPLHFPFGIETHRPPFSRENTRATVGISINAFFLTALINFS